LNSLSSVHLHSSQSAQQFDHYVRITFPVSSSTLLYSNTICRNHMCVVADLLRDPIPTDSASCSAWK
uniref:Ovule protein n=1 Tax=Haemonchus placei TaxID=6290 RepID=A0A0N4WYM3_HAEPC